MEAKEILKRRLLAIVRAAIYGAAIFDAMIVSDHLAYGAFKGSDNLGLDLAVFCAWVLAIPRLLTGINAYVVNGLIGAALFAVVAGFWQFGIKKYET
jgi:hypothetical protein